MARFIISGSDQTTEKQHEQPNFLYHAMSFKADGATAGTLTVKGKMKGSGVYEDIPDGVVDLSAIASIQFTGSVESFEFTLVGFTGTGDIQITDTVSKG